MKFLLTSSFVTLIILIIVSACSDRYSVREGVPSATQIQATSKVIKGDEKKVELLEKEEVSISKKNTVFYGDWIVTGVLKSAPVSTHDDDDIKFLKGKKITYSEGNAIFDGNVLTRPFYSESSISKKDFFPLYYVDLEELGMQTDSVISIDVCSDQKCIDDWPGIGRNNIGGSFIIKDKDTLIVSKGGDFFELKRVEPK
ncbi:hypothetical protein GK047_01510 [Paenibacillus sp. SYP-B3998]|uniref:Lipoprotein n=1 Tax=Paenibacillus sp. SYP-B3998 TaxID=2678564 RepID=A0A6G3ZR63_9BACL|nr:hypothetical protein [Paenibacillus sp. SYP-B3998]NEW04696.1 hypothetical protein [Paenibacillus sp. SYP-B3998]